MNNKVNNKQLTGFNLDVKIYKKGKTFFDSTLFGIKIPFIIAGVIGYKLLKKFL